MPRLGPIGLMALPKDMCLRRTTHTSLRDCIATLGLSQWVETLQLHPVGSSSFVQLAVAIEAKSKSHQEHGDICSRW